MYSKARFALSALTTALLTAVALDLPASEQHGGGGGGGGETEQKAREAYGKLPLAFVPNAGQTGPRVRYSAQAAARASTSPRRRRSSPSRRASRQAGRRPRLAFLGANPEPTIEGQGLGPGRVNYLIGNDPSEVAHESSHLRAGRLPRPLAGHRHGLPRRRGPAQVRVRRPPGGEGRGHPARVSRRGAALASDAAGRAPDRDAAGTSSRTQRPVSYQEIGGRRVPVESRFLASPDARATAYGFAVGDYDAAQPLVIDPGLLYSTYLGGSGTDHRQPDRGRRRGQRLRHRGDQLDRLPDDAGAFDTTPQRQHRRLRDEAERDRLRARLLDLPRRKRPSTGASASRSTRRATPTSPERPTRPTSRRRSARSTRTLQRQRRRLRDEAERRRLRLVYSTYLGGSGNDQGLGIAVDGAGSAYVTGRDRSRPTSRRPLGAFDTLYNGGDDAFVTKLNAAGSAPSSTRPTWAERRRPRLRHRGRRRGQRLRHRTRPTRPDFPTTAGAFDTTHNGGIDAFVTKLNAAGSAPPLLDLPGRKRRRPGLRHRRRRRGQRLRHRRDQLDRLPDDRRGLRHHAQRRQRRVRDEAERRRLRASLYSTYLGGAATDRGFGSPSTRRAAPTSPASTDSTNFPTTAGAFDTSAQRQRRRLRDEAERGRLRPRSTRPTWAERRRRASASRSTPGQRLRHRRDQLRPTSRRRPGPSTQRSTTTATPS